MRKFIIPPVFVALSLLFMVYFFFKATAFSIFFFPFNLVGVLISIGGFALMSKARSLFKKNETTLKIEKSSTIIKEGVFARSRNPMYIGMFLLLLGIAICLMNLLSIIMSVLFILFIRILFIPKEEKLMHDEFGEDYVEYKKNVKRWF